MVLKHCSRFIVLKASYDIVDVMCVCSESDYHLSSGSKKFVVVFQKLADKGASLCLVPLLHRSKYAVSGEILTIADR